MRRARSDPPPLRAELGGLWTYFERYGLPSLRRAHRIDYDVAANWKLVVENFGESNRFASVEFVQVLIVMIGSRGKPIRRPPGDV